jgi:hypothetical protein
VAITSPALYGYVSGKAAIMGNARSRNFKLYRVEVGQGLQPTSFTPISGDRYTQVSGGTLAIWDTTGLEGVYTIQLSVVEHSGNYQQVRVPVTVDNITPTIRITYPYTREVFIAITEGDNDKIRIQADAKDNAAMNRVEFFMDGDLLGVSTVAPYHILWPIVLTKTEETPQGPRLITQTRVITATAYDQAGNATTSDPVEIQVAPEPPKKKSQLPGEVAIGWQSRDIWDAAWPWRNPIHRKGEQGI